MAKTVHNDVLDAALNVIKSNATTMTACSAEPTSRAEALSLSLADVAVATGDFTISDGDTSGRKLAVAAKSAVPVDVTGNPTHIALIDATRLLYVTEEGTAQTITAGNTTDFPTWDVELADPT